MSIHKNARLAPKGRKILIGRLERATAMPIHPIVAYASRFISS